MTFSRSSFLIKRSYEWLIFMGGKFAISFEFRSLAINFWIWGIKMFRLDLKIYLDRKITNRYILFIYWAKGGPCQQEESINKIPFYYLFTTFHNFQSTRICTKMNNAQFLSHGNKRNFKKFAEQKNSFVTMGQSFGSRVTTLIHIEYEYLFIFFVLSRHSKATNSEY